MREFVESNARGEVNKYEIWAKPDSLFGIGHSKQIEKKFWLEENGVLVIHETPSYIDWEGYSCHRPFSVVGDGDIIFDAVMTSALQHAESKEGKIIFKRGFSHHMLPKNRHEIYKAKKGIVGINLIFPKDFPQHWDSDEAQKKKGITPSPRPEGW